jgi:hypothetical protein
MKGSVITRALLIWFSIFMLLQPILSYRDYLLDTLVKSNTYFLAQVSAPDGFVSPTNRQVVLNNLQRVGITPATVQIISESTIKDRGERLDVEIQAPRANSFLLNFGDIPQSNIYIGHAYVMSERMD